MTKAARERVRTGVTLGRMVAVALVVAGPAAAQDLSPISDMLTEVADALTGPIGLAVAVIAVIATGFTCMMGRLNAGWFISVFVGVVLIFGADTIIGGFAGGGSG